LKVSLKKNSINTKNQVKNVENIPMYNNATFKVAVVIKENGNVSISIAIQEEVIVKNDFLLPITYTFTK